MDDYKQLSDFGSTATVMASDLIYSQNVGTGIEQKTTVQQLQNFLLGGLAPQRQSIPVTSNGQASFATIGYTPGLVNVFIAGIRLNPSQYQALDGLNVIITDALVIADLVPGMTVDLEASLTINALNAATPASVAALDPANQPAVGTLAGTEITSIRQGAGLFQVTMTKIAQWVINTFQGFTQAGTGAVARTVQSKFTERVSLLDFGADPTGVVDSYTAIMAFWSALKISNRIGYIPGGTYKSATAITWDLTGLATRGIKIEGDGQRASLFDVTAVTASPAFLITKSDGAGYHSVFKDFGILGNVAGNLLQLGLGSFGDSFTSFQFENLVVNNSSTSTSAVGVQVNYVLRSQFTNVVSTTAGGGDSWQINAAAGCTWTGGAGNLAQNGIHLTAGGAGTGQVVGNTFIGVDLEKNTHACVKIDTANAHNNTFIGGTFGYNPNTGPAWVASTVYAPSATVTNGGNVYLTTAGGTSGTAGGPTGTGTTIVDGGVTWSYVSGATSYAVDATAGAENFFMSPNTVAYPSGTPAFTNFYAGSVGTGILGKFGMTVGMEISNPSFSTTLSISQTLPTGIWTKLQFNTVTFQSGIVAYDPVINYRFIAPFTGRYRFSALADVNATNTATAIAFISFYKNGASFRVAAETVPAGASAFTPQINAMVQLNAGDYIECWANIPASSGSPQAVGGATVASYFEGSYIG